MDTNCTMDAHAPSWTLRQECAGGQAAVSLHETEDLY